MRQILLNSPPEGESKYSFSISVGGLSFRKTSPHGFAKGESCSPSRGEQKNGGNFK